MEATSKVQVGGLCEFMEWEIASDYEVSSFGLDGPIAETPCPHCHSPRQGKYDERLWTCPRAVVAFNEGGHNSTAVCLDCILEAAAKL